MWQTVPEVCSGLGPFCKLRMPIMTHINILCQKPAPSESMRDQSVTMKSSNSCGESFVIDYSRWLLLAGCLLIAQMMYFI